MFSVFIETNRAAISSFQHKENGFLNESFEKKWGTHLVHYLDIDYYWAERIIITECQNCIEKVSESSQKPGHLIVLVVVPEGVSRPHPPVLAPGGGAGDEEADQTHHRPGHVVLSDWGPAVPAAGYILAQTRASEVRRSMRKYNNQPGGPDQSQQPLFIFRTLILNNNPGAGLLSVFWRVTSAFYCEGGEGKKCWYHWDHRAGS